MKIKQHGTLEPGSQCTWGRNVRTLEVLIEQTVPGDVRPMELAAHAPVSALVPAIVDELQLPRTDLLDNRLVHVLRYAPAGPVLPDDKGLAAVGIPSCAKLAVDPYALDNSVTTFTPHPPRSHTPLPHP